MLLQKIKKISQLLRALYGGGTTRPWWGLVVLGLVAGVLEGLGVSALIPLFSFVTGGQGINADFISRFIHKFFDVVNLPFTIWTILISIPTLFILKAIVMLWYSHWKARIAADYENRHRVKLYRDLLQSSWPFLFQQKLGHIENTLMVDMSFTVILLDNLLELARITINFSVFFTLALAISWRLTLVATVCGTIMLLMFRPILSRSRLYARYKGQLNKLIAHFINEQVVGLKTIKSLNVVAPLVAIGANFFDEIRHLRVRQALVKNLTKVAIEPILIVLVVIIFSLSYASADFNLGVFVAIIYLIQQIFSQVDKAQRFIHTVFEAGTYAHSVLSLESQAQKHRETLTTGQPFSFKQQLEFRSVSFSYQSDRQILEDINLTLSAGEIVALVGPSGSGKTTLVDLMLRLFKPTAGEIFLDGQPIAAIDMTTWRRAVSYVPQEPFLLNETIKKNIRFYDDTITDEDISRAIKLANIEDLISRLPLGLETVMGERGLALSGGERQRVVLARALARRPKILVLDEATSALDLGSETAIGEALVHLRGEVTVVIIAHRPAMVAIADRVLALEGGLIKPITKEVLS